jgi:dipeptidyl aminopeptidase/acylaminoacyl peptidase
MKNNDYPSSPLILEQKIISDGNYDKYIASYTSNNLKIYGLLTIPQGKIPEKGWPVIIFNHGYIRPNKYKTIAYYKPYIRSLTEAGYIVFMPDYRGHDKSEGEPDSQYFSPSYTIDALNALYSLKDFKYSNPNRIGIWGHSDGGNLIMRAIVTKPEDIKVAVIWGGVMAPYEILTSDWQQMVTYQQPEYDLKIENKHMDELIATYGYPKDNPEFWSAIDPLSYLSEINIPIQLHVGEKDEEVPTKFSEDLHTQLLSLGKTSEYYIYPNGDHNIVNPNYHLAMQRTIEFFDKYLK